MILKYDLHTHTTFSHGKGSVEDNIKLAIKKGLSAVGISDHGVGHFTYGVKRRQLGNYILCIEKLKKAYAGRIDVRCGIELNLTGLDGSVDLPDGYDFDPVILGYHKATVCADLRSAWRFYTGYTRIGKSKAHEITTAYIHAIERGNIDILAHPGYGVPIDYQLVGKACADNGTLFEINNKHRELTVKDLLAVADTGAKFIISSDAHAPQDVGDASSAIALAKSAGLDSTQIVNITEE